MCIKLTVSFYLNALLLFLKLNQIFNTKLLICFNNNTPPNPNDEASTNNWIGLLRLRNYKNGACLTFSNIYPPVTGNIF